MRCVWPLRDSASNFAKGQVSVLKTAHCCGQYSCEVAIINLRLFLLLDCNNFGGCNSCG
jgi:hypothetical protein